MNIAIRFWTILVWELQNFNSFTWRKTFKLNFTTRKVPKLRQFLHTNRRKLWKRIILILDWYIQAGCWGDFSIPWVLWGMCALFSQWSFCKQEITNFRPQLTWRCTRREQTWPIVMFSHALGFDLTHETVSRWDFYPGTTVPIWPDLTLAIAVGKKAERHF